MRWHMHLLPTYFPDRDPPFDQYYQNILEQVALAEELGWECFWFTEHHFLQYGGPVPNPAVMMAAAAARTARIRLGSAISILPLHHPVQLAEDYAMVDVASGGRLEFGIGFGNTPLDYEAYGVPREERHPRFDEAIEIITRLWTQGKAGYEGKYWSFPEISVYPTPVQRPHPRIWVAASAESLRWAGEQGYDIMTVSHPFPPEVVRKATDAWREGLAAGGHDPKKRHCKLHLRVWVDNDGERARAAAQEAISRYDYVSGIGRVARPGAVGPQGYDWDTMLAQGRNVYGTPEECVQGIRRTMANFDFDVCSTTFNYGGLPFAAVKQAMRLWAEEVMPAFNEDT